MKTKRAKICTRRAAVLQTLVALALLSGCGGGGGGGGGSSVAAPSSAPVQVVQPPVAAPVAADNTTRLVSGAATKGPIRGANVAFYALDGFGFASGAAVASTTTDSSGNFSISLPASVGAVLVETRGGSFIDESDQETDPARKRQIVLAATEGFVSILATGASTVAVTPFTEALVTRARSEAQATGGFLTRLDTAVSDFSAVTGFNVLTTVPADPLAPASTATAEASQYALMLGGIANVTNNMAIQLGSATPTYDIIKAVIDDLVDGTVNGKRYSNAVTVTVAGTSQALPTDVSLEQEMSRFASNNFSTYSAVPVPVVSVGVVANPAPQAVAGADFDIPQATVGSLNGSASFDPDQTALTYVWTQVSGTPVTPSSSPQQDLLLRHWQPPLSSTPLSQCWTMTSWA